VEEALKENLDSIKSKEIRDQIDKEIYSIYGLNPDEIEVIEESYRKI
jgi:hypothetical protein